jgi:hypothetical protein
MVLGQNLGPPELFGAHFLQKLICWAPARVHGPVLGPVRHPAHDEPVRHPAHDEWTGSSSGP